MKDCKLIVTLPRVSEKEKLKNIYEDESINEVRLNTGVNQLLSADEVIYTLKSMEEKYNKKTWIDIKGRQLRITKWADPYYDAIELNHNISIEYPAKIYSRNGSNSEIIKCRGNKIIVNPIPKEALGAGQSVNIIARSLEIDGYLTDKDKEYLNSCNNYFLNNIMASFVENKEDIDEIRRISPFSNVVSKIESINGINYIKDNNNLSLMAARDDLYIETGKNINMLKYLKLIIEKDKGAILASSLFSSLEDNEDISISDYSDLEYMYDLGYRKFMLCDNISNKKLSKALKGWKEFVNE